MKGMSSFVVTTLLVAILCAVAFVFLVQAYLGRPPEAALNAAAGGDAGEIVSLLSFVLGTAATAGGAIASVILSNIALRLSMDAERRETATFSADRIDFAAGHFSRIASGLNRLLAAARLIEERARHYERQYLYGITGLSAHEADKLNRDLSAPSAQFADALSSLAQAVDDALCDEFTRFTFQRGVENGLGAGRLAKLAAASARLPQAGKAPSLSDLPQLVATLRAAEFCMRDEPRDVIVNAWRFLPPSLKVEAESHVMRERPALLFMFVGNMVDLRRGELSAEGGVYCVRAGAALIEDLARGLPSAETILDALFERYAAALPKRRKQLKIPVHFDPRRALSAALIEAIEDSDALPDALVTVTEPAPAAPAS
jgi:hypothetical protein